MEHASKVCFKCGKDKPLIEYYAHKRMADGRLNKCKDCAKIYARERKSVLNENPQWKEAERARHREKYYRLGYKEKHKPTPEMKAASMQRYKERYPEKKSANSACQHMAREGEEMHHWSYKKEHWKDVIYLTPKHHAKSHRFLIYDQERMMYRRCDTGILLDTKESHELFITEMIQTKPD